jgi:hypothetical protein
VDEDLDYFPYIADDFEFLHSLDPRISVDRKGMLTDALNRNRAKLAKLIGDRTICDIEGSNRILFGAVHRVMEQEKILLDLLRGNWQNECECIMRQARRLPRHGREHLHYLLSLEIGEIPLYAKSNGMPSVQFRVTPAERVEIEFASKGSDLSSFLREIAARIDLNEDGRHWPEHSALERLSEKLWFRAPYMLDRDLRVYSRRNGITKSRLLRCAVLDECRAKT